MKPTRRTALKALLAAPLIPLLPAIPVPVRTLVILDEVKAGSFDWLKRQLVNRELAKNPRIVEILGHGYLPPPAQ